MTGNYGDIDDHPVIVADVEQVEIVTSHHERVTLRVGDVFLKIDADQTNLDVEVEAMSWRRERSWLFSSAAEGKFRESRTDRGAMKLRKS